MSNVNEILEQLIGEREAALMRVRLLNEVIDVIQGDGLSKESLEHLKSFLETSSKGKVKKVLTISSKMNLHTDLLNKFIGYTDAKTVKEKIVVILKIERRFLHVKEIAEILLQLDLDESKKVDDYIKNVSPVLSTMAKNGDRINKVSEGGNKKSTIWGLQDWIENGQAKIDFLI